MRVAGLWLFFSMVCVLVAAQSSSETQSFSHLLPALRIILSRDLRRLRIDAFIVCDNFRKHFLASYNQLHSALSESKVVAIVGLSDKPHRPSYFVGKYLIDHGIEIVPVNPTVSEILGRKSYPTLRDIPHKVDMVDCFRRSEQMPELAQQAVDIRANVLWMQLSVINEEAKEIAEAAGLSVIMDRCVKIEYARLFGGLNWAGVNTKIISAKRPRHIVL